MGYGKAVAYLGSALLAVSAILTGLSEVEYMMSGYRFMDVLGMWYFVIPLVAVVLVIFGFFLMRRETRMIRPKTDRIDKEGTTWTYHPPPERKPETGVGSEAWEANRLREIQELREKERKKAARNGSKSSSAR